MIHKSDVEELVGKEIASQMESTLETADNSIKAAERYGKLNKKTFTQS